MVCVCVCTYQVFQQSGWDAVPLCAWEASPPHGVVEVAEVIALAPSAEVVHEGPPQALAGAPHAKAVRRPARRRPAVGEAAHAHVSPRGTHGKVAHAARITHVLHVTHVPHAEVGHSATRRELSVAIET